MTREWILSVLDLLPVWRWPLFLWDVVRVQLWADELALHVCGYVSLVVTRQGRIVVVEIFEADRPDPADWTRHAPRAPWAALDLDVLSVAHDPACGRGAVETFVPPLQDCPSRTPWRIQGITGPG